MQPTIILYLAAVLVVACGHSFLTSPDAYNRKFQLRDCFGSECQQACPNITSDARNSVLSPAKTWARGEKVRIQWARNNHATGLVRFALVPVASMMKRRWHKRLSLYEGCWTQGLFPCSGELQCGTDMSATGLQRDLSIPRVFPDGDYVFAMVWYGGIKQPETRNEYFSDYWSCSFVKISGGDRLGGKHRAFFEKGDTPLDSPRGTCRSAIDAPGVCPNDGCVGPPAFLTPRRFRDGRKPRRFAVADVRKAMARR